MCSASAELFAWQIRYYIFIMPLILSQVRTASSCRLFLKTFESSLMIIATGDFEV